MKEYHNIIIIVLLVALLYLSYSNQVTVDTQISDIKNKIEIRTQQNDSIYKKLDSIAVKKVEIINNIDNRKTSITNLYNDLKLSKPKYDTSLNAAIIYLKDFSNKQY